VRLHCTEVLGPGSLDQERPRRSASTEPTSHAKAEGRRTIQYDGIRGTENEKSPRADSNIRLGGVQVSRGIGFDSQSIVHGNSKFLFASEVALGRLDGHVTEQKLDLIQFAAHEVAETGAGAPQIVWGQFVDARASRGSADDVPKHLG